MFGAFRPTAPLSGGLLWKIPWRISRHQKARHRQRLRRVDNIVSVLDNALQRQAGMSALHAQQSTRTQQPAQAYASMQQTRQASSDIARDHSKSKISEVVSSGHQEREPPELSKAEKDSGAIRLWIDIQGPGGSRELENCIQHVRQLIDAAAKNLPGPAPALTTQTDLIDRSNSSWQFPGFAVRIPLELSGIIHKLEALPREKEAVTGVYRDVLIDKTEVADAEGQATPEELSHTAEGIRMLARDTNKDVAERRHGKGAKQGDYVPEQNPVGIEVPGKRLLRDVAAEHGTIKLIERWKAEMPTEGEMLAKDKYTMFDKKVRGYRKGVHKLPKWTRVSQRLNPPGF